MKSTTYNTSKRSYDSHCQPLPTRNKTSCCAACALLLPLLLFAASLISLLPRRRSLVHSEHVSPIMPLPSMTPLLLRTAAALVERETTMLRRRVTAAGKKAASVARKKRKKSIAACAAAYTRMLRVLLLWDPSRVQQLLLLPLFSSGKEATRHAAIR